MSHADYESNYIELENGKKVEKEHFFEAKMLRRLTKESEKYPLLTREQEQEYIKAYQEPRDILYAQAQLVYGKQKYPDPSSWGTPEERAVIKAIVNPQSPHFNRKARDARERIVLHNLRLLKRFGKTNRTGDLGPYDIHIYGMLGLQHALDKFDRTRVNADGKPNKFSTYAIPWLRQFGQRAVTDFGRAIRVPIHIHDQINKLGKIYAQLASEHFDSASPTPEKLSEVSGMPIEQVRILGFYKADFSITSLDRENFNDDDDSSTLLDSLSSQENLQPEELAEKEENKAYLSELFGCLTPEDSKFMQLMTGCLDGSVRTAREMASVLQVSRKDIEKRYNDCLEVMKLNAKRDRVNLD